MMLTLALIDRYRVSWLIVLCSAHAGFILWHPPSNFSAFPDSFRFIAWISRDERIWGTLFGVSALSHGIGLAFFMAGISNRLLTGMRRAGLSGSFFFWLMFSVATMWGNPDSLFGIAGLAVAILAGRLLANFGQPGNV